MAAPRKTQEEEQLHHQTHHDYLRQALRVHVVRDDKDRVVSYEDVFGEEGVINYHLFRGSKRGEGHADRILDHYLGCRKMGFPITCSFSEEYLEFLRKERNYEDARPPPLSLRARLMAAA